MKASGKDGGSAEVMPVRRDLKKNVCDGSEGAYN